MGGGTAAMLTMMMREKVRPLSAAMSHSRCWFCSCTLLLILGWCCDCTKCRVMSAKGLDPLILIDDIHHP